MHTAPTSTIDKEFVSYVVDLMQHAGLVRTKSMFGAYGISLEGLTFALITNSTLYFKVDQETEKEFITKSLTAFSYKRKGRDIKMSYYQIPEDFLEDVEAMNVWVNKAYGAAPRATAKK